MYNKNTNSWSNANKNRFDWIGEMLASVVASQVFQKLYCAAKFEPH